MAANRTIGSSLLVFGAGLTALSFLVWLFWRLDLLASLPEWLQLLARTNVPRNMDIFLIVFGACLLFYGWKIWRREPWALLVAATLTALMGLYLLAIAVALVLEHINLRVIVLPPGWPNLHQNRNYIAVFLALIGLALFWSITSLYGSENRDSYAEPFGRAKAPLDTCDKCGRIKGPRGCPVHDRPPINALLVRDDTQEAFPIKKDAVRIGRNPGNDLVFNVPRDHPPGEKHPHGTIARQHAAIALQDNTFFITSWSLKNPTEVDGKLLEVPPGQDRSPAVPLAHGSRILLGAVPFTFYPDASAYTAPAPVQQ